MTIVGNILGNFFLNVFLGVMYTIIVLCIICTIVLYRYNTKECERNTEGYILYVGVSIIVAMLICIILFGVDVTYALVKYTFDKSSITDEKTLPPNKIECDKSLQRNVKHE